MISYIYINADFLDYLPRISFTHQYFYKRDKYIVDIILFQKNIPVELRKIIDFYILKDFGFSEITIINALFSENKTIEYLNCALFSKKFITPIHHLLDFNISASFYNENNEKIFQYNLSPFVIFNKYEDFLKDVIKRINVGKQNYLK
jgi:hypothetical protein